MKRPIPSKEGQVLICTHTPEDRKHLIPIGIYTVEFNTFEDEFEAFSIPRLPMYYLTDIAPVDGNSAKAICIPRDEFDYYLQHGYTSWGFHNPFVEPAKLAI
ncbi:MAG: hypothetical protein KBC67_00730 [Candidatus Pacebacteria bacterium]|nr:hypothetical protein [Candidatus Paceibacterota bacterium]